MVLDSSLLADSKCAAYGRGRPRLHHFTVCAGGDATTDATPRRLLSLSRCRRRARSAMYLPSKRSPSPARRRLPPKPPPRGAPTAASLEFDPTSASYHSDSANGGGGASSHPQRGGARLLEPLEPLEHLSLAECVVEKNDVSRHREESPFLAVCVLHRPAKHQNVILHRAVSRNGGDQNKNVIRASCSVAKRR